MDGRKHSAWLGLAFVLLACPAPTAVSQSIPDVTGSWSGVFSELIVTAGGLSVTAHRGDWRLELTEVKGEQLDRKQIEDQTRATISAGGTVSARVRSTPRASPRTIQPGKNPVTVEGDVDSIDAKHEAIERILDRYNEVREESE